VAFQVAGADVDAGGGVAIFVVVDSLRVRTTHLKPAVDIGFTKGRQMLLNVAAEAIRLVC
jgi:hypothetical protein